MMMMAMVLLMLRSGGRLVNHHGWVLFELPSDRLHYSSQIRVDCVVENSGCIFDFTGRWVNPVVSQNGTDDEFRFFVRKGLSEVNVDSDFPTTTVEIH
uniref:Putative secreted protein n=1 Tax=Anopheles darlingi TaxID=43151 RepID=A0A2M4D0P2_ANODA